MTRIRHEERSARLNSLDLHPTWALAASQLTDWGYPTNAESLRAWAYRQGLSPRGGHRLTSQARKRLEAAETALGAISSLDPPAEPRVTSIVDAYNDEVS